MIVFLLIIIILIMLGALGDVVVFSLKAVGVLLAVGAAFALLMLIK